MALTYQADIKHDGRFYFTVGRRAITDSVWDPAKRDQHWEFFHGQWRAAGDTIYLQYEKSSGPPGLAPFLIKSGKFYSQYTIDLTKRFFLERYHFHHGRGY